MPFHFCFQTEIRVGSCNINKATGSTLHTDSFIFTAETYLFWNGESFLLCGTQRFLKYQEEVSHVLITTDLDEA